MAIKLGLKKFSDFDSYNKDNLTTNDQNNNEINDKLYLVGYEIKDEGNKNFKIKLDDLADSVRSHISFEYELHPDEQQPKSGKIEDENILKNYDKNKIHLFKSDEEGEFGANYNEWIIVSNEGEYYWEQLGASINLSQYLCIAEKDLGNHASLYNINGNYSKSITYDNGEKNLRVLECIERLNNNDTIIQPEITYNDNSVFINATVIDIFDNKTCLIGDDSTLVVRYIYNYK